MRIVIVGPGALGTIFAAALGRGGHDTVLLGRSSGWLRAIQNEGLYLQSRDGTIERLPATIADDPAIVATADIVIFLVKTIDTKVAIHRTKPFMALETPILTLQNGIGNSQLIREQFGASQRVLPGTTSQAGQRLKPNLVIHSGEGPTLIGYDIPRDAESAAECAKVFSNSGLPAAAVPDIEHWIWRKAAVNAAINGLTALGGFTNGAIAERPDLLEVAESVAEEAAAVARARHIELGDMRAPLRETIAATARNRSSMLQDIEAGRETEVDAIHGAILDDGIRVGIGAPTISLLAALIRAKTRSAVTEDPRGISFRKPQRSGYKAHGA